MKLIVGLGNPGKEYERTRHNAGFMVMEKIEKELNVSIDQKKFKALVCKTNVGGEQVLLMKPQTYMNLSGEAVQEAMKFFRIDIKDLLVIYDDMDLPIGAKRIRKTGSAGGHNGMKSMIKEVGTNEIARLRIGIGRSKEDSENKVIDFVLSNFSKQEMNILQETLDLSGNIINDLINNGLDYIMNNYNK
jgi:PTH1 family peptidyl-tRNA hydrolase